jgi:putative salt-induced outer membrane protein YdiY
MPRRLSLAFLLLCLAALEAGAAELYLKNGDKLSGVLLRREAGRVFLRHPLLGEINLPESELARVQEDPSASPTTLASAQGAPALTAPAPGQPAAKPTGASNPADKALAAAAAKAKPSKDDDDDAPVYSTWLKGWKRVMADTKGTLELGYQEQDGRKNTTNLSFRASAEYTNLPNNYRFDWRYYYGDYNDIVQTDKKDWTFRWRHDLNKRIFTQTITTYASDRIKHIDLNLEQSAGMGYAALNTNRQKFNIGAGLVGQHRIILEQDTGLIALGELFEDYTRRINKRFSIRQESRVQYSPAHRASYTTLNGQLVRSNADVANYRYNFNAAIEGKLTDRISLNLRFEYEFDNTVVETDLKADRRMSTTLGYSF